jgi:uncharacterized membrane protein YkvA (DUF1232 family)
MRNETLAISLACRDPRVPWYARALAAVIVGYALSPIDLIPDFIPVLGYLDDLVLIPLGIALLLRMIPVEVMEEAREAARKRFAAGSPRSGTLAALIIAAAWAAAAFQAARAIYRAAFRR